MFFSIFIYSLFFFIAYFFYKTAYKKSSNDWNIFLQSPYHKTANIFLYISCGWGFHFFSKLLNKKSSLNQLQSELITAFFTISIISVFVYIMRKFYYKKMTINKK